MPGVRRYRVRTMSKEYVDEGPDLLRPIANATRELGAHMDEPDGWFFRRRASTKNAKWTKWNTQPVRRSTILNGLDNWNGANGAKFQVGRHKEGGPEPLHEVLAVALRHKNIGANAGATLMGDLALTQFGSNSVTLFGFVCKRFNGSTDPSVGWSDHAWKDAADIVPKGGLSNDKLTDWFCRMGREGCLGSCSQILGSVNGIPREAYAPHYQMGGSAPESHAWHVHCSYRQHHGARPPCA